MPRRLRYSPNSSLERSWDSPRAGWFISLAVGAALIASDLLEGPQPHWIGVTAIVPFIAASMLSPLSTAMVGFIVVVVMVLITPYQSEAGGFDFWATQMRLILVGTSAVGAVVAAMHRERGAMRTQQLALVAACAQDAVMRPIPSCLGPLRCTTRYQSALEHARIGGDVIEVMRTDHGIRVIVGDVQGKGLAAIRLAGMVLGSFRELAFTTPDFQDLAKALSQSVSRVSRPEEFITAALVQVEPDGTLRTILAGHPAPILVTVGDLTVTEVDSENDPPLGLLPDVEPTVRTSSLGPGQRLVLVTDGLLEARRPRRWWMRGPLNRERPYFPAAGAIGEELSHGDSGDGLDRVLARADAWTGYRRDDDRALLVLELAGPDDRPCVSEASVELTPAR